MGLTAVRLPAVSLPVRRLFVRSGSPTSDATGFSGWSRRAEQAQANVLFNRDCCSRGVKEAEEARRDARIAPGSDGGQTLRAVVERVGNNDALFVVDLKEAIVEHLRDKRVYGGDRVRPFEHVEFAHRYTVDCDTRLGSHRLRIDEEAAGAER
jgi:hypothetical protein